MRITSINDLSNLVKSKRKELGMTQVQLAEQVGVQALWVSQFERGKATAQIGLVLRTLKTLNIPLHLGETDTSIK